MNLKIIASNDVTTPLPLPKLLYFFKRTVGRHLKKKNTKPELI